nr:hypothetical protein [Bacteroidales bacterium]
MKRWSKLQSTLYSIIAPEVDFQIHCVAYPMLTKTGYANQSVPRYWITIGKDIVWDFPKCCPKEQLDAMYYPYCRDLSIISQTIRDYIDCPQEQLLAFDAEDTRWGLIPILRACDRRIGKRRLAEMQSQNLVINQIINKRLNISQNH